MIIFNVKSNFQNITVDVELRAFDPTKTPRKKVYTADVEKYLVENSIEFGDCISESYLNNRSGATKGTWIFEKKIKKTLDKPAEKVILVKENKTEPKKKSKAKKKTSK